MKVLSCLLFALVPAVLGCASVRGLKVSCSQIFEEENGRSVLGPRPTNEVRVGWKSDSTHDYVLAWGPNVPSGEVERKRGYSFETSGSTYFFLGVRGDSIDIGLVSCFPRAFTEPGFNEETPEVIVLDDPGRFFTEAYDFPIPFGQREQIANAIEAALSKMGVPIARPFRTKKDAPVLFYTANWFTPSQGCAQYPVLIQPRVSGLEERWLLFIYLDEQAQAGAGKKPFHIRIVPLVVSRYVKEAGPWKKETSGTATEAPFRCIKNRISSELRLP